MAGETTVVEIDGHRLALSNLDKVLYPATGTTKAEVLQYYALAAPALLPVVAGRPVTRKRWPNGVDAEPFFVKNTEAGAPRWVPRQIVAHSDRPVEYPMIDSVAVLTWMAQMAALELHVPQWRFDSHRPGRPDRMVFDLDPGPGVGLAECAQVARWVREVLQEAGSDAVPVTSGSKGLHLYVALDGTRTSDQVSATAKAVGQALESRHPKLVTSKMAKSVRPGRVFLDWSQNSAAKTTIAAYSMRGREQPMVAAPRAWDELADADLAQLDFTEVLDRLAAGIDPWRDHFGDGASTVDGAVDSAVDGVVDGPRIESAEPATAGPDADTKAAAAAYAIAAMGGGEHGEKKHGPHRWADPLEGPRGRVVRKDFSKAGRPAPTDGDAATAGAADGDGDTASAGPADGTVDRTKISTATSGLLPMLATAGELSDIADPAHWRFEGKWDGIRALAEVGDGRLRLIGRSSRDMTAGYPELAEIAELLDGHTAVLDGEIVALEPDGRTSFPLLQQRMNLVSPAMIARATRDVPVSYYAFDLLEIDGVSLLRKTYDARRRLLTALQLTGDHVEVPVPLDGDLASALRFTREQNWEGVVAKRGDSIYRPGTRSGHWLKMKNQRMQEVVIIGWRRGAGRRSGGIGSLLVAVPGPAGLQYAGRVGTGFSDRVLDDLYDLLKATDRCPVDGVPAADVRDAVWVEPGVVGEVSFAEWTPDHRLRMASWRGLRPDKTPSDVELES